MEEEETAELVESGVLRVDRVKALEKLVGFQLEDPAAFALCWVRAASAAGAASIDADFDGRAFFFRFDGTSYSKDDLKDPYGGLFAEEGFENPRTKHLAYGILGALRLGAREIRVVSGTSGSRVRLKLSSIESDSLESLENEEGGPTVIRVSWPRGEAPQEVARSLQVLRSECAFSAPLVRVGGRIVAKPPMLAESGPGASLSFFDGRRRGRLDLTEVEGGRVDVAHLGVRVETAEFPDALRGLRGRVDDPDLRLTASLAGVVRDERYAAARAALAAQARRLLLKAAGVRAGMLARQARLAHEDKWGVRFGRWTHWILARCSELLSDPRRDEADAFKRALWRVPLFSDMRTGAPVSLYHLWKIRRDTGAILVSNRRLFRTVDMTWDITWVPDERAFEALESLFGSAVRRQYVA
jgi:hypothetical protein